MFNIKVCYFALLREKAGMESETLSSHSLTYADLYEELSAKYQFGLPASMVQVAVNDEFTSMKSPITESAKVVFIPPVAGG